MLQSRQVRLFRNNRNQAIRIPVEFELPGEEATITRDGDRLIIEPVRKKGLAAQRLQEVGEETICTSIIAAAELRYGCAKKGSPVLLKRVKAVLAEIPVLAFEVQADTEYGGIRAEFEAAGQPIGGNDPLIAAHAYALGATVVTANEREFRRVRGLHVENWLSHHERSPGSAGEATKV